MPTAESQRQHPRPKTKQTNYGDSIQSTRRTAKAKQLTSDSCCLCLIWRALDLEWMDARTRNGSSYERMCDHSRTAAEGSSGAGEADGRRRRGRQQGCGRGRRQATVEEDKRPAATLEEYKRPTARSIGTHSDRIQHSDGSANWTSSTCSWRWTYAKAKSRPAGKRAKAVVQEIGLGVARVATCKKNT